MIIFEEISIDELKHHELCDSVALDSLMTIHYLGLDFVFDKHCDYLTVKDIFAELKDRAKIKTFITEHLRHCFGSDLIKRVERLRDNCSISLLDRSILLEYADLKNKELDNN